MTLEQALSDRHPIDLASAARELEAHGCEILGVNGSRIMVANATDPAEEIDCTPAAILEYLGY